MSRCEGCPPYAKQAIKGSEKNPLLWGGQRLTRVVCMRVRHVVIRQDPGQPLNWSHLLSLGDYLCLHPLFLFCFLFSDTDRAQIFGQKTKAFSTILHYQGRKDLRRLSGPLSPSAGAPLSRPYLVVAQSQFGFLLYWGDHDLPRTSFTPLYSYSHYHNYYWPPICCQVALWVLFLSLPPEPLRISQLPLLLSSPLYI